MLLTWTLINPLITYKMWTICFLVASVCKQIWQRIIYVKPFLSVLRYTNSDYPFGIFKLFWLHKKIASFILSVLTWFIIYIYYWNLQFLNKVLVLKTKLFLQCQSKHRLLGRWYPWGLLFHQQQYHEENLCDV